MSWELCVIGTVVSDAGSMVAAEELRPSDFTGENIPVWSEIMALHRNNALSAGALGTILLQHEVFKTEADVTDYLQKALTYSGPTIEHYVDMVLDGSIKRSVQRVSGQIAMQARLENVEADELLDYAETEIMKLRRHRNTGMSMADLASVFIPRLKKIQTGEFRPAWKPQVTAVRNILKYAEEDELVIVAARPSEGKSTYLRYEAYHHARQNKGVLVILIENSEIEYMRYMTSLVTGIDSDFLKTGNMTEDQMHMALEAIEKLATLPIHIEYANNINAIRHIARRYAKENKIDQIQVDYIQLISNGLENKNLDVSATSVGLKNLARELKIPVIAASQLSRDIEKRGERSDPKLSDLRDSGSLEQDANIVIFPRGVWPANPTAEMIGVFPENRGRNGEILTDNIKAMPIQFHIAKNRNGKTGVSSYVKWVKSTGNYYTLTRPDENIPR